MSKLGGVATGALKGLATGVAAVSTAVTAAGAASIAAGNQFETSFAKASTLFGNVAVDTDNLNKKILEMSSSSGIAATELNETLYQAMSAGVPVTEDMSEALRMVDTANKLAKGGFTSSASAVDVLTTAINAYGMKASEAANVADILITTQNLGKTSVDELSASLGKVLPIASAFGVSMQDVGAAEATLTANGIATAEATTYLKSMFNELGKSGSKVSKALEATTGKTFDQMMKDGASLGDVIGALGESVGGDTVAFNNLWSSSEAGIGALSILNSGTESYNKTLDAMKNSSGAAAQAYETMADTFETKTEKAKESVKNLGIALYENLLAGKGSEIMDLANSYIGQLQTAFEENGVDGLVSAAGNILSDVVTKVAEFAPRLIEVSVSLIETLVQGLTESMPQIIDGALQILDGLVNALVENAPMLIEAAAQMLVQLALGLAQSLPTLIPTIVNVVLTIVDTLLNNIDLLVDAAIQLMMGLTEGLINALPVLIEKAPEIVIKLADAFIRNAPKLWKASIQCMVQLAAGLIKALPQLLSAAVQIMNNLSSKFRSLAGKFKEIGRYIVEGLLNGIKSSWDAVISWITGACGNLIKTVKGMFGIQSPSKVFRQIGAYCTEGFTEGLDIESPIKSVASGISSTLSSLENNAKGFSMSAGNGQTGNTFNFYDTQTSPDAIYQKFMRTQTFGLAGAR